MDQIIGQSFGFAGGIIGIATGLPQMLRIRARGGNTDGLALSPWILMLATFASYSAYGLTANSPAIWICNILTFFTTALVVTAVLGNGAKVWAAIIVGGLVTGVIMTVLPSLIIQVILAALTANRLPQLVRTWLNRKTAMVSAVSIPSLAVALTSGLCWVGYALFMHDNYIVFTSLLATSITLSTALLEAHIARLAKQAHLA